MLGLSYRVGWGSPLRWSLLVGGTFVCAACRETKSSRPSDERAVLFEASVEDAARVGLSADATANAAVRTDAGGNDEGSEALSENGAAGAEGIRGCPKEMVSIAGKFCVDRYEGTLVDDRSGQALSPHYPPEPGLALRMFEKWQTERWNVGPLYARALELPRLPSIERSEEFVPRAVSRRGVVPQGYMSEKTASVACQRAGKRLCTLEEWRYACRGERQLKYPYGPEYQQGICNVHRSEHPAALLHNNASAGHSDPRLGLVSGEDGPLLRKTGGTRKCASRWGRDAVYDMVGNVDEWIDDPAGTFVGGFFSRTTKEGCESVFRAHPIDYWDYSLGLRCCRAQAVKEPP